ncbi:hypothetical protein MSG28_006959, partial [Choristoneura fumiferana]
MIMNDNLKTLYRNHQDSKKLIRLRRSCYFYRNVTILSNNNFLFFLGCLLRLFYFYTIPGFNFLFIFFFNWRMQFASAIEISIHLKSI